MQATLLNMTGEKVGDLSALVNPEAFEALQAAVAAQV